MPKENSTSQLVMTPSEFYIERHVMLECVRMCVHVRVYKYECHFRYQFRNLCNVSLLTKVFKKSQRNLVLLGLFLTP